MASNDCFESSVQKGSDLIHDYCCSTCEEDDDNTEALFHCEKCLKFFCNVCVKLHNQLHRKHSVKGRQDMDKWPIAKAIDDTFEQCQEHEDEKLKLFCEDHQQILCTVCHVYNHQKCSHVVLIADKLKILQKEVDFLQISTNLKKLREKITQEKHQKIGKLHSAQKSYQKVLDEIEAFRKKINDDLDHLEKTTKQELDTMLTSLKSSLETDIETLGSAHQTIHHLQDELYNIEKKSPVMSFILYTKCTNQFVETELLLHKLAPNNEVTISFSPDTTFDHAFTGVTRLGKLASNYKQSNYTTKHHLQYENESTSILQDISRESPFIKPTMSNPNRIIRVTRIIKYNVKMANEKYNCCISGMCETASGELLVADWQNNTVKLLSPTYAVVAHYNVSVPHGGLPNPEIPCVPEKPWAMCNTDSNQVAVAVSKLSVRGLIHFLTVKDDQIVLNSKLILDHSCRGISHHRGKLYLNSCSAIYQYNIDGSQRRLIYKAASEWTVESCAVSPDGERIYVAKGSTSSKKLLTLSSDGRVFSTLTDPLLQWDQKGNEYVPACLHVTYSGQVLVCGGASNTILQVDRDGKQRLAEVVNIKNGECNPSSVYINKCKSKLIVGSWKKDEILVFDAEWLGDAH